ncbi:GYD domain-containing protein [Halospeciosus flavus]|uniref:GYD domain-containing protein n=1 Tax=Halospeciosus flavus TaxID=3032283 RepID=A0ABD5Z5S2_9EURY|nr:GYD domain-containing protein [Halospeciosus flavus]
MSTYVALADVNEGEFQNVQELAAIWGDVRADIEGLDCELRDAYVLLGDHDALLVFDAEDEHQALEVSMAVERYGVHLDTMEAIDVDDLGKVVEDI